MPQNYIYRVVILANKNHFVKAKILPRVARLLIMVAQQKGAWSYMNVDRTLGIYMCVCICLCVCVCVCVCACARACVRAHVG